MVLIGGCVMSWGGVPVHGQGTPSALWTVGVRAQAEWGVLKGAMPIRVEHPGGSSTLIGAYAVDARSYDGVGTGIAFDVSPSGSEWTLGAGVGAVLQRLHAKSTVQSASNLLAPEGTAVADQQRWQLRLAAEVRRSIVASDWQMIGGCHADLPLGKGDAIVWQQEPAFVENPAYHAASERLLAATQMGVGVGGYLGVGSSTTAGITGNGGMLVRPFVTMHLRVIQSKGGSVISPLGFTFGVTIARRL